VIIAGFGRVGQIVGRMLRAQKIPFTALEHSMEQVESSRRFGTMIYYGDNWPPDLLRAAHVDQAEAFVLATDDAEQTVRMARGDTVRVTLEMTRIAIQLPAVQTVAQVCRNPGAPGRDAEAGLVQLYQQLQQNAETFRLLSLAHPYVFATQRQFVTTYRDSVIDRTPLEDLRGTSAKSWSYEPGKMVFEKNATTNMHLPTLATFAEESFAKAHCFYYAAVVDLEGQQLVRVDFAPDAKIREPDVSGSIYLDPSTFQIRRSDITLSKVPYHLSGQITGHTVHTWFAEVMPGVPIIGAVRAEVTRIREGEVLTEMQQVVQVHFDHGKP